MERGGVVRVRWGLGDDGTGGAGRGDLDCGGGVGVLVAGVVHGVLVEEVGDGGVGVGVGGSWGCGVRVIYNIWHHAIGGIISGCDLLLH